MPPRRVYIPVEAIPELQKHKFRLPSFGYSIFEDPETHRRYYVFKSKKGDIGAVLAIHGISREKLGYCTLYVKQMGGYEEDLYTKSTQSNTLRQNVPRQREPQQLAMEEIFRQAQYDESSHLTPDGKRKRRKRRKFL
ncbi:MAG: hypothetical protein KQA41_04485 [Candidatus Aenigmarchaeota archaeon]|nr:hypothetical protein [Candidatus Aenigmarchaeota archaeon]